MRNYSQTLAYSKPYTIKYSQNFIKSSELAEKLVNLMEINSSDLVIEIGSGKGALTNFLSKKSLNLIAVEKDIRLTNELEKSFKSSTFKVVNADFLTYNLPLEVNYKVVGNIPFALTSRIIKKLLESKNPPQETFLILQKEAALRLLSNELYGLKFKPWFKSEIIFLFNKKDFSPSPKVNVVMLHITKRDPPLISNSSKEEFLDFIAFCFTKSQKTIDFALKKIFSNKQISIIKVRVNLNNKLKNIEFNEWLNLFASYQNYSENKKEIVKDCYKKLNFNQELLEKNYRTRTTR